MEWVEVTAKSVEVAVELALAELGLSSVEEATVEIIQQPDRGFLGFGGDKAIVRVQEAPKKRARRGRGGGGGQDRGNRQDRGKRQGGTKTGNRQGGTKTGNRQGEAKAGSRRGGKGRDNRGGGQPKDRESRGNAKSSGGNRSQQNRGGGRGQSDRAPGRGEARTRSEPSVESTQEADVAEQANILEAFMSGLIEAFGLEGETTTRVEDDIIYIDVTGEQTEALVGSKGAILQAILDLMKIIVQRKTHHRARIRLDIAGYAERRRQALIIYSQRLSEQVLSDGEEVMLEPMHPGDRKVVHDAVGEIEGVRTWSEGEEPYRSVIIGTAPGFGPVDSGDDEE
jgi:spoIIIJ-associated protein